MASVEAPPGFRYCPACGAEREAAWHYCRRCGSPLRVEERAVQRPREVPGPASVGRRAWATVLDVLLLFGAFVLLMSAGLEIAPTAATMLLLIGTWVLVVGPLYFGLYHAFGGPDRGAGATPGQHELRLEVRDADAGGRLQPLTAVRRAYAGLLGAVLVVPAIADAHAAGASDDGRSRRDVRFGSVVWTEPAPVQPLAATADAVTDLFARPAGGNPHLLRRSWRMLGRYPRTLILSTLLTFCGLALVAVVLVPLLVGDAGVKESDAFAWIGIAVALFTSGVFWTQAVLITAMEAIRTGEPDVRPRTVVGRVIVHANALSVTLLLLIAFAYMFGGLWMLLLPAVLAARLALLVPPILLEDRRVLESFGRSWTLTEGSTLRCLGLLVFSAAVIAATAGAAMLVAIGMVDGVSVGLMGDMLLLTGAMLIASVPGSLVIAWLGGAWCLLYYDQRAVEAGRKVP